MAGIIFSIFFSLARGDENLSFQYKNEKKNLGFLETAKFHLVNGHPQRADSSLRQIFTSNKKIDLTRRRYSAIVDFIKGRYQSSLTTLSVKKLNQTSGLYQIICPLKILNMILIKKSNKEIEKEVRECQWINRHLSPSNLFLMEVLSQPRGKKEAIVFLKYLDTIDEKSMARPWVKTALYLGREDLVLKNHSSFPPDRYLSRETRDALGAVYFRSGKYDEAVSILKNINSINGENIKGHLALIKKDYESAWTSFQSISHKHPLSDATVKFVLLSWKMKKWKEGLESSKRVTDWILNEKEIAAIQTAFLIKLDQRKTLQSNLNFLQILYKDTLPPHVEILNAYGRLLSQEKRESLASSEILCEKSNPVACWLYSQIQLHPSVSFLMDSMEQPVKDPFSMLLDLKRKSPLSPLKESIFIDQRDIDDLDLAWNLKEDT